MSNVAARSLQRAIREAISIAGGRASSEKIKRLLKRRGFIANQHDVLRTLRLPDFELTDNGWANGLQQLDFTEELDAAW